MTLRAKTIIITVSTLLALILAILISTKSVLHRGFGWVETADARRSTVRAVNALDRELNAVELITHDWASWDETYAFVNDRNKSFIDTYLYLDGFATIDINHIVFIDPSGHVILARGFDLQRERMLSLPDSLTRIISRGDQIVRQTKIGDSSSGIIMLSEGPLMFASRPIITTKEEGPVRGTLFFGRYLDSTQVRKLETTTQFAIEIQLWDSLSADFLEARTPLAGVDSLYVHALDDDRIAGYAVIRDVYGKPALVLRVLMPREILAQEKRVQRYLIIAILIVGIVFTAVMFLFLESAVLSRLKRLRRDFSAIGQRGDFTGRIVAEGSDELSEVATAGNRMLNALEESHNRIQRRNREMRTIMDTVSVGLLSLDREFRISGEYSESAAIIFGDEDLSGKDFVGLLGLIEEGESTIREYLQLILEDSLPAEDISNLNPFPELPIHRKDGAVRWVRIDYCLMHRNEARDGVILVQAEDITEGKELAEQAAQAEADAAQIVAAAENPDIFREFLSQSVKISLKLREGSETIQTERYTPELVDDLLRDAHTLKGTASAFGAQSLSNAAQEMEARLSTLRDTGVAYPGMLNELEYFENLILADLDAVRRKTERIYGGVVDENETWLRVPLSEVESAVQTARNLLTCGESGKELFSRLQSFRMIPAEQGLARATRIIEDLIRRTEANADFLIEGADVLIDCETVREVNSPLVHLFRNSLAHGIELPEERIALGKSDRARITLSVRRIDGGTVFEFSDDGRGIDPEQIRKKAVERGILTPEEAERLTEPECIDIIFRPGFSTAEMVTALSGRGIGLDAVLTDIRHLNGTVAVDSSPARGARFTIFIPVIDALVG